MERTNTNSNFNKVTIVMLIITMIALIALSGTYAKYSTTASGTGIAVVAKWDFDAAIGGSQSSSTTINLYDTMLDVVDPDFLTPGHIAPGTSGEFEVALTSNSEVATEYKIEIKENPSNIGTLPQFIKFRYTSSEATNRDLDLGAGGTVSLTGRIPAGGYQQETVTIQWEWPYDSSNDYLDSLDGENAATNPVYAFDIVVTGTQIIN